MKQSMGSLFLYNIIIVFIVLIFALLAMAISYSKAFRVNSRIINSIEKFEGYNDAAIGEINKNLNTIGYKIGNVKNCADAKTAGTSKANGTVMPNRNSNYKYCIYRFTVDSKHYSYGVLTYMEMEIPVISQTFEIPIYSKTDKIYKFK